MRDVPNFGTSFFFHGGKMSKKIEQWQKEIIQCQDKIKKQNLRINELKQKIKNEKKQQELDNNKLIADIVRNVYGEVNEENIEQLMILLQKNGHTINGMSERV